MTIMVIKISTLQNDHSGFRIATSIWVRESLVKNSPISISVAKVTFSNLKPFVVQIDESVEIRQAKTWYPIKKPLF